MTLSLMRILQRDEPGKGFIVPVWDFYGTTERVHENHLGERSAVLTVDPDQSLLTLNAIDGTVIDRKKGR